MSAKRTVNIQCPTCQTIKDIEVPDELFAGKKMGLIKIHIEKSICCDHQFIAFFSKSGKNCGYEKLDVAFELTEKDEIQELSLRDLLKSYGDYIMTLMFHSVIINVPIIILHTKYELENKAPAMNMFVNEFLPEKYHSPLLFTSEYDLEFHKNPRNDALVISAHNDVENTPWPTIPFDYEKEIISKALDILDDKMQPLIVQEELNVLFNKAEYFNTLLDKWAAIYEEDVRTELNKEFPDEIDDYMYRLLLQILERRFKADMSKIKNPTQPKGRRLR